VSESDVLDCLIVGGGPAGLTAAVYLARFRRNALLVDAGASRAAWIPETHNCPGFPEGIAGKDLLSRMRTHADRYGATLVQGRVDRLDRVGDLFSAQVGDRQLSARKVLLATGVVDRKPNFPNLREVVWRGNMRLCPICDGYEVIDQAVAVLGPPEQAVRKALFLRAYTSSITVLLTGSDITLTEAQRGDLAEAGIACVEQPVLDLEVAGDDIRVTMADGLTMKVDVLYPALGADVLSELAAALGADCNDAGCINVDAHQRTSVPGLYAAGDVVNELNQISVATGHAAIAATDIHNALRERR
jgi:thioredoxin reductase (NADPH)